MLVLRRIRFDFAVMIGCFAMLGYFAWHGWQGPRGFAHWRGLEVKLAAVKNAGSAVLREKVALEGRVALMRPDHVDPDMLEELARSQLDLAGANDLVVRVSP
jgi:cell division protein FtsB